MGVCGGRGDGGSEPVKKRCPCEEKREHRRKGAKKDEKKGRVIGGSRFQSCHAFARATTPGHYFLANPKVNGSRQGCVGMCVLLKAPERGLARMALS